MLAVYILSWYLIQFLCSPLEWPGERGEYLSKQHAQQNSFNHLIRLTRDTATHHMHLAHEFAFIIKKLSTENICKQECLPSWAVVSKKGWQLFFNVFPSSKSVCSNSKVYNICHSILWSQSPISHQFQIPTTQTKATLQNYVQISK